MLLIFIILAIITAIYLAKQDSNIDKNKIIILIGSFLLGLLLIRSHNFILGLGVLLLTLFHKQILDYLKPFTSNNSQSEMSVDEAYDILNLKRPVSADEINKAYYTQIKLNHPDKGGSKYIATKINQARKVLLKEISK